VDVGKFLLNGVDINKTGTLDSAAYRNRDNDFLKEQTIQGHLHATDVHATDSISSVNFFASGLVKTAHFQLTTTPSNGYVLKCDSDGNGSWQAITNSYKGTWDAHTNTPTIADGMGTAGDFYLVSEGDTIDLGSGNVIFLTGGTAIYNGSAWEAVNPSQAVTTVNSLIGDVQLDLHLSGDTLWITGATDSINLEQIPAIGNLQDTVLAHNNRLIAIENDTLKFHIAYDSVTVFHNRLDDHTDSLKLILNTRLPAIENDTTHYQTAWDSVAIFHNRLDDHTDSLKLILDTRLPAIENDTTHWNTAYDSVTPYDNRLDALEIKGNAQDIWQKDSDSTTSSKYPVNLAALRLPPDSRVVPFHLPVISAPYGDTVSLSTVIGGKQVMLLYGISDGAGGLLSYGVKVDGSLTVSGDVTGTNINNYFQKELTADAENNIPVGFPIGSKTKVFYNGTLIEQTRWTGSGTSTITLSLDTRKYDTVTITN
jgi:hypothetical protein